VTRVFHTSEDTTGHLAGRDTVDLAAPGPQTGRALVLPVLISVAPLTTLATLYFLLPVIAPSLMAAVGLKPEAFGWVGGAVGLGSVLFYLTSHAITPVLGPVGSLRMGLIISAFGGLCLLSGSWPLIMLGGALIGFGYGTTTPSGSQILADFTPKSTWGTFFSLRQAGVPAGGVLAATVAALSIDAYGWQGALFGCIVLVIFTATVLFAVPLRFNRRRPLERFVLARAVDWHNIARPMRDIRTVPGLRPLVAAGTGLAMGHGAVTQFLVIYLTSGLNMPMSRAALLFAIMQTCAIGGRIVLGAVADRIGHPMAMLRVLAPLSAVSCVMLAMFSAAWSLPVQIAAAVAIGSTVATWNGLYLAEIARRAPAARVSQATASAAVFTFFSYMITPPLVGLMATSIGWRPTFMLIALAPIMAGVILFMRPRRVATADGDELLPPAVDREPSVVVRTRPGARPD
jgi:MFS family permease